MFTNVKKVMMHMSALLIVLTMVFTPAYASSTNTVTLIDDGYVKNVTTDKETVSDVLAEHGISLNPSDLLSYEKTAKIEDEMTIEIERARDVYIPSNGKIIVTAKAFDREFLKENGFSIPENDFYVRENYDAEKDALVLDVIECSTKSVTVTEKIENGIVYLKDDSMLESEAKLEVAGQKGLVERTYSVRYENGVEVSKILTKEVVIEKPVDRVVRVGTKSVQTETAESPQAIEASYIVGKSAPSAKTVTTNTGKVLKYKNVIDVVATAYDLSFASCGKYPGDPAYGITASGMRARVGVIAVDPRIIPLGTKLYITAPDGSWTYGEAIAGDTGGAIKGYRVDLFYNTYSECIQFGRRSAKVYILE